MEKSEAKGETEAENGLQDAGADKQQDESKKEAVPIHKLFAYADIKDWILMFVGTLGAIAHGLIMPAFFLVFGSLINSLGSLINDSHEMYRQVSQKAIFLVYLGLASLVASWAEVSCWMQTGERQTARLRVKYLEAMLNQDVGFFDTEARTGDVVGRISSDMLIIQEAISEKMGLFLHFMTTFVGGFILGFITLWRLGVVTLGILPVIAISGGLYAYALTGVTSKSQAAYATAGSIAEQAISQARIVYSFVGETKTISSYAQALKSTLQLGYKAGIAKGLGIGFTYGILFCCWALLMWYGGVLIRQGHANGGKVLTSMFAVIVAGMSLGQATPSIAAFSKARVATYQLMQLINHKPTINVDKLKGKVLTVVQGNIEFCNVSFSYPSRPDVAIFENLCLQIPAGKTVAVVGGSGSGKSTIISLIERFYDPTSGKVLLDNHDIRTLQLHWLRTRMGLVNQEPALFATTIEQNILYGKQDATIEDVEKAAISANAHNFISQLPDGYKTQVGERGVQLSGGQKQRVAIARAMLKDPSILLLDEATSALDAESEHVVQEALDHLMIGRTTVIVAHRLSTIRNADLIAVVQQGNIVELGTHEDLIAKGQHGTYAALVRLQAMAKDQEAYGTQEPRVLKKDSFDKRPSIDTTVESARFSRIKSFLSRQSSTASDLIEVGDIQEDKKVSNAYFWRLLRLNAPEWPFFTVGTIGAMFAGVVNPSFAYFLASNIKVFYDTDFNHMKKELAKNSIIFICIGAGTLVAYFVDHYFFAIAGENLTKRMREKMLTAILRNEVSWFDQDENSSGQITARLASGATYVRAAMGDRVAILVQDTTLLFSAFIIAFIVQWRVAFVITATIPLLVAAAMVQQLFVKGFAGDIAKAHNKATTLAGEAVSNIRVVAAFNAEIKLVNLFSTELDGPKQSNFIRGQLAGLGYGMSQLLLYFSYGLTLWYGAKLVKDGVTNFGDVMKAFFVLVMTSFAVAETISMTPDIIRSNNAMKSVFKILDRQTKIEPDSTEGEQVYQIKGELEFQKVVFYYPTRPDVLVFKNLNLKVHSGQSLAIVGASGSGKSSVISLVERFYDPVNGRILVDGKDIRMLNLKSFRRHVGLVQQEPALFATSIYENILYGKENASESEVIEASKAANAHNFVSSLPAGYKTEVGERGAQLSGGQKQRVAIARAVLKNPTILLLDEATSALDAESERIVQDALDRLMKGRTTIVVAHRLSTIKNADKIAVIEDGKIIEQGAHEDLVENTDGAYYRLIKLQQGNNRELAAV